MKRLSLALCSTVLALSCPAAEAPAITAADMPRVPATEPKDAIKTITVKKGFHVELAAAEPNVASPICVAFDERGRMFVVEMIDYSERREENPHLGRIRLLEDTDGDGVYDKSTVYADNLPWPTGVFPYKGGIFVIATPDVLYLKDTKGDGKADLREVVGTGLAEGVARVNVQGLANSLIWGLDNRIHGTTSGNGGVLKAVKHPEAKALELHGRDFDFVIEPRTLAITMEAGGGQYGTSFDDYGHRFTCNNDHHIREFMYDERYAARNPAYVMPPVLMDIPVDGPAAEVYRISPEEPWRVIRTKWRIAGQVSGPVEGGGRSSGYFTGASGLTIYRGNAFPKDYYGDAFVAEVAFNLVHHKKLFPSDVGFKAERVPDEQNVEFLASTDNWFRPVDFANAPDGTLYMVDMYREVIEHPWSLPENMKKLIDLNSGNDRGRIYRIAPDGFKTSAPPRLDKASTKELVALLANPNAWHRETASRLIYERQDKSAVSPLVALLEHSTSPLARLHALHSLEGLGALHEAHVLTGLHDEDAYVREHSVKLAEAFMPKGVPSKKLWPALRKLTKDPAINVRYQLAFTLGEVKGSDRLELLQAIVAQDTQSPWVQAAVLSSLAQGSGEMFVNLSHEVAFRGSAEGQDFLRQLLTLVGAKNDSVDVERALAFLTEIGDPGLRFALARALGDGLHRAGNSLQKSDNAMRVKLFFAEAKAAAVRGVNPEATRVSAVRLLGLSSYADCGATLLGLIKPSEPQGIQVAAVSTLARFTEQAVAPELIARWAEADPPVRSEMLSALLARPERALALLKAVQAGTIQASDLTTSQIKFLQKHSNKEVRELALKALGEPGKKRQQVIDAYQTALQLPGDAARGKEVYLKLCVSCHRLGGNGFALGPDLVTVKSTGKEKMLVNILDPNREVAPQYLAYDVETKDGESQVGVIANETTTSLTMRQAFGKETVIMRSDVKGRRSLGQSLMPEGLEQGLTPQDFANLLEYITTAEEPKK
jgi:putative membrane-bound dehydrogenase-like protein